MNANRGEIEMNAYQMAVERYDAAKKATSMAFRNYNARQIEFDEIRKCAIEEEEARKEMEDAARSANVAS